MAEPLRLPRFAGSKERKLFLAISWMKEHFRITAWGPERAGEMLRRPVQKMFDQADFPATFPCLDMSVSLVHILRANGINPNLLVERISRSDGTPTAHFVVEVPGNVRRYVDFRTRVPGFVKVHIGKYDSRFVKGNRTEEIHRVPFGNLSPKRRVIGHIPTALRNQNPVIENEIYSWARQGSQSERRALAEQRNIEWKRPMSP